MDSNIPSDLSSSTRTGVKVAKSVSKERGGYSEDKRGYKEQIIVFIKQSKWLRRSIAVLWDIGRVEDFFRARSNDALGVRRHIGKMI